MKNMLRKMLLLVTVISIISSFTLTASASDPYVMDYGFYNKSTLYYYVHSDRNPAVPTQYYYIWLAQLDTAAALWNQYFDQYNIDLEFKKTTDSSKDDIYISFDYSSAPAHVYYGFEPPGLSIDYAVIVIDDYQFFTEGYSNTIVKKYLFT